MDLRERIQRATKPISVFLAAITIGIALGFIASGVAKYFMNLSDTASMVWVGFPAGIMLGILFWKMLPRDF